jgi:phospholipase A1
MTRIPAAPLFFVALAMASTGAVAQDLARCVAEEDPTKRLDCYDDVSGRKARTKVADKPEQKPAQAPEHVNSEEQRKQGVSLLGDRWELDQPPKGESAVLVRYHNANYVIGRYSDHVNGGPFAATEGGPTSELPNVNPGEAKFQVSFKARMLARDDLRAALWLAYTQQSHWQIGNAPLSRPFRESDYQPEVILALKPDYEKDGWSWRLLNLGLVHQSNGRGDPLSRSWNRIYAQFGVEYGKHFAVLVRPWYRVPEKSGQDDMPDIHRYYGSGDVVVLYRVNEHTFTLTGRGNPRTGFGAAQFEWSTPQLFGPFRFYLQAFSGYGESLIDYKWRQNTIGVGVSLNDIL